MKRQVSSAITLRRGTEIVQARAVRNGTVLAESEDTILVEGNNHYYPQPKEATKDIRACAFWRGVQVR